MPNSAFCFRKKYLKVQKDIEDACRDSSRDSFEEVSEAYNIPLQETMLPTKCVAKMVSFNSRKAIDICRFSKGCPKLRFHFNLKIFLGYRE